MELLSNYNYYLLLLSTIYNNYWCVKCTGARYNYNYIQVSIAIAITIIIVVDVRDTKVIVEP